MIRKRKTLLKWLVALALVVVPVVLVVVPFVRSGMVMGGYIEYSAAELLNRKGFDWRTAQTGHVFVYFEPGTHAEKMLEKLKRVNEAAYDSNLRLLDCDAYPEKLHTFAVDSREKMKRLIHYETNGKAFPRHHTACFVVSESIWAATAHELFHVMHHQLWGQAGFKKWHWLSEGMAVNADEKWQGQDPHGFCGQLHEKGELIPLSQLCDRFGSASPMITYPQAGSFVRFLYEEYGVAKLRELWQQGHQAMRGVFSQDLSQLEKAWLARIARAGEPPSHAARTLLR